MSSRNPRPPGNSRRSSRHSTSHSSRRRHRHGSKIRRPGNTRRRSSTPRRSTPRRSRRCRSRRRSNNRRRSMRSRDKGSFPRSRPLDNNSHRRQAGLPACRRRTQGREKQWPWQTMQITWRNLFDRVFEVVQVENGLCAPERLALTAQRRTTRASVASRSRQAGWETSPGGRSKTAP